jgi:hypothetical protein
MRVEPQVNSGVSDRLHAENFIGVQLIAGVHRIDHSIIKAFNLLVPNESKFSPVRGQERWQLPEEKLKISVNFLLPITHFTHLVCAADFAICDHSSFESFLARAAAPALPLRMRADFTASLSVMSPVAILFTITATPITPAGRFSLFRPTGMTETPVPFHVITFLRGHHYRCGELPLVVRHG